jgi:N-methylhydantoinase A
MSRDAIEEKVARPFGMDVYEAAQGMVDIVNQNISNAVRRLMMNRGFDIREFALLACGGAGPLQAVDVAKNLGMKKVIIPRYPGITAAIGLLMSDVRYDYVESMIVPLHNQTQEGLRDAYDRLIKQAGEDLLHAGFDEMHQKFVMYADIRYVAQTHELTMEIDPEDMAGCDWSAISQKFNKLHHRSYGYSSPLSAPLELVSIRCSGF